jgi:hypothetical protein
MSTIVLISCVSKKLPYKAKARELYVSPLFRLNLQYAQKLTPTRIFILSAKFGLVNLDDEIEPYDITLNNMSVADRRAWSQKVLEQMKEFCELNRDHFIILAGQKYRQYLLSHLKSYDILMEGLRIGKQLQYLKRQLAGE